MYHTTRLRDIRDGSSQTFLLAESDMDQDDEYIRTAPLDYCGRKKLAPCVVGKMWAAENRVTTAHGVNSDTDREIAGTHSYHPGGSNFNFADAHVAFIGESIDQAVLEALTTRSEDELIPGGTF